MLKISPISIAVGKAIKQLRLDKHMTQNELAERTNLERSYISQIERGQKNPTLYVVSLIADKLQVSLLKLIELTLQNMPVPPPDSTDLNK